jgi:hypothetical protein
VPDYSITVDLQQDTFLIGTGRWSNSAGGHECEHDAGHHAHRFLVIARSTEKQTEKKDMPFHGGYLRSICINHCSKDLHQESISANPQGNIIRSLE